MQRLDLNLFYRGLVIGFSIAAPVGPIGVLCIRRTLSDGRASGLLSGLGAATADAFYGCVAAFGLTAVSNLFLHQQNWLRLAGGVFLCYLGLKPFLARPPKQGPAATSTMGNLVTAYVSTLLLTLTNPMTIVSFLWVFAAVGLGPEASNYAAAGLLVFGV